MFRSKRTEALAGPLSDPQPYDRGVLSPIAIDQFHGVSARVVS